MAWYGWVILIAGSLLTLLLSKDALWKPNHHGFYRAFAFETIFILIAYNAPVWFPDPWAGLQILSWLSLGGSILLAWHGFQLLKEVGSPERDIEATTILVTKGAYRYIRHPLYGSLLLLDLGALLKRINSVSVPFFLATIAFLTMTARVEEVENQNRFGAIYQEYMQHTKMFIPFLW